MANNLEIVTLKVNDIHPYKRNPRKNDQAVDAVMESIKQCGYCAPIVVDEDNVVLAGHTRLKAIKKLGWDECEVVIKEGLTEDQKRKYRLLDNKTNEIAEWDIELLEIELDGLEFNGFDFGFDAESEGSATNADIIEDEAPEPPTDPVSKRGDIWQLGRHRVMCGDSTNNDDVDALMEGEKADIAFSSPPYNAGHTATEDKMGKSTKYDGIDDDKSQEEYREFIDNYLQNAINASDYVFMNIQSLAGNKRALIECLYDNRDSFADVIIWDKEHGQPAMAENVLNSVFEFVYVFSEKANRSIGTVPFRGTIDNILHLPPQRGNEYAQIHNATFSVEFAAWFVSRFANESVLDNFCGTGTTLIACEQLGKRCFAMEYEPKYVDVIIQRWENLTGEKAVLLNE